MCLLLFSVNPNASPEEFFLVLVSVRDEIYDRPTKLGGFWEHCDHVIGGMDMEPGKEGGTWLAMSKTGKIGVLLNILQPDEEILPNKKGRGFLAADFVIGEKDCLTYLNELNSEASDYNEFLLVTMDYSSLKFPKIACFTNSSSLPPVLLEPGIHAFGNSITPETPWLKVSKAKEKFCSIMEEYKAVSKKDLLVEDLFALLQDSTRYPPDETMKKQGKSKPRLFLEKLNALFVHIPEANYGSRCHTIVLIDGAGNVDYFEKSRPENLIPATVSDWTLQHQSFKLCC